MMSKIMEQLWLIKKRETGLIYNRRLSSISFGNDKIQPHLHR